MKRYLNDSYISFSKRELALYIGKMLIVMVVMDLIFYRSIWALIPLGFVGYIYLLKEIKDAYMSKTNKVRMEFKELLLLSVICQRAGYSVEKSLINSYRDIKNLYGDESVILKLLQKTGIAISNNRPIDEIFEDAGIKMNIEDIRQFGEVYEIAYSSSGNISSIMEKSAEVIMEKLELQSSIEKALNERKLEWKIMTVMPFFLIAYISVTNKEYFNIMYHNPGGIAVMSLVLIIYILSYLWGQKILDIKI